MRRAVLVLWVPLMLMGAAPSTMPELPDEHTPVPVLIDLMGDPRSIVREQATQLLTARGPAIRAALLEAAKSPDPEISGRAAAIVRSYPWDRPNDTPQVRDLLTRYKTLGRDQRPALINQLLNLPNSDGVEAVFRLLRDETDAHARWSIVRIMRAMWEKPAPGITAETAAARRDAAKSLDTTIDDGPALALAAAAWKPDDFAKSTTLYFRAALAAELDPTPGQDQTEVYYAFKSAMTGLWDSKQFDSVARLYRRQAERSENINVAGVPEPICQLFALHAKFGPLAGFADDCRTYRPYLLSSPILHTHAHALLQHGHPWAAAAIDQLAILSGGDEPAKHHELGDFLQANGWQIPAVRELKMVLKLQPLDDTPESKIDAAVIHFAIGTIYGTADKHAEAAGEIDQGLQLLDASPAINRVRAGKTYVGDEAKEDLRRESQGHHLLDALARGDRADIENRIKQLQALQADDPEVVQEMVAYLTKAGDSNAADQIFAPIETKLRADLAADPKSGGGLNSLAWFLARSGRKLDEALKLATQAVAGDPNSAAFIDTLAEVHFQRGEFAEAVQLEKKAIAIEPGRPELESQMRRFLRGKKN